MKSSLINDLLSVRDWIRWGASEFERNELFFGHGTDNAWDEASVLVLWAIKQPWEKLPEIIDVRLTTDEKSHIAELIGKRIQDKLPAAYITGEAWFAGLKFHVSSDVLVPRSPIAELIQQQFQPWLEQYPERILDLCTGSGCIGIACAMAFDGASVDLSDVSAKAIEMANRNIAMHGLEDRVQAIESDMFSKLDGNRYDLIVSNPPYVDARDFSDMPAEYQAEPELGLTSGSDGLDHARIILSEAANHLTENGLLVLEVGNSYVALEEAFPNLLFLWPEFENGGHGVCILDAEQLRQLSGNT